MIYLFCLVILFIFGLEYSSMDYKWMKKDTNMNMNSSPLLLYNLKKLQQYTKDNINTSDFPHENSADFTYIQDGMIINNNHDRVYVHKGDNVSYDVKHNNEKDKHTIIDIDGNYISGYHNPYARIENTYMMLSNKDVHPFYKRDFYNNYYKHLKEYVEKKMSEQAHYTEQAQKNLFDEKDKYCTEYKKFRQNHPEAIV